MIKKQSVIIITFSLLFMLLLTFSAVLPAHANDDIKPVDDISLYFYMDETYAGYSSAKILHPLNTKLHLPWDNALTPDIVEGPTHPEHPKWISWAVTNCEGENPDGTHNYSEIYPLNRTQLPKITKNDKDRSFFYLWSVRYKYAVYNYTSKTESTGGKIIVGKGEAKTEDDVIDDDFGFYDHLNLQVTAKPDKGYDFLGWACVKPGESINDSPILSTDLTYNYTPENGGEEESENTNTLYALFKKPDAIITDQGDQITLSSPSSIFTNKNIKPVVVTNDGRTLTEGVDYTLTITDSKGKKVTSARNAGTYLLTITGKGKYKGTAKVYLTIKKIANTLKIKAKKVAVKYSAIKNKAVKLKCKKVMKIARKGKGKGTYKLAATSPSKYKKYFKVNTKTGNVTIKKGLKKGTYKIKIKVKAAGNVNYKACTKNVICKIKVK